VSPAPIETWGWWEVGRWAGPKGRARGGRGKEEDEGHAEGRGHRG
jgi:hypothetical protein